MAKLLNVFMAAPPFEMVRERMVAENVQVVYAAYDDGSVYVWCRNGGWFKTELEIPTERP